MIAQGSRSCPHIQLLLRHSLKGGNTALTAIIKASHLLAKLSCSENLFSRVRHSNMQPRVIMQRSEKKLKLFLGILQAVWIFLQQERENLDIS